MEPAEEFPDFLFIIAVDDQMVVADGTGQEVAQIFLLQTDPDLGAAEIRFTEIFTQKTGSDKVSVQKTGSLEDRDCAFGNMSAESNAETGFVMRHQFDLRRHVQRRRAVGENDLIGAGKDP